LNGLKIAPYYGCQVVRPGFGFDHPETPQSMEINSPFKIAYMEL
jgi:heterodisulfide reductase subunit B